LSLAWQGDTAHTQFISIWIHPPPMPSHQGNCIVHHMFGHDVVQRVNAHYGDAFHTAHLEVSAVQCCAMLCSAVQ
jgi:quinolinate synthase